MCTASKNCEKFTKTLFEGGGFKVVQGHRCS